MSAINVQGPSFEQIFNKNTDVEIRETLKKTGPDLERGNRFVVNLEVDGFDTNELMIVSGRFSKFQLNGDASAVITVTVYEEGLASKLLKQLVETQKQRDAKAKEKRENEDFKSPIIPVPIGRIVMNHCDNGLQNITHSEIYKINRFFMFKFKGPENNQNATNSKVEYSFSFEVEPE